MRAPGLLLAVTSLAWPASVSGQAPDEQSDDVLLTAFVIVRGTLSWLPVDRMMAVDTSGTMIGFKTPAAGNRSIVAQRLGLEMVETRSIRRCEMVSGVASENCRLEGPAGVLSARSITISGDSATVDVAVLQEIPFSGKTRVAAYGMLIRLRREADGTWIGVEARPTWAT